MSEIAIVEHIREAVKDFAAHVSVQLLHYQNGFIPLGTGTFFEINGRLFLVTARHLFDGMEQSTIAQVLIPEGR